MTASTAHTTHERAAGWIARILPPLVLVFATLAAFAPAFSAEFVTWDDDANFLLNRAYRGLGVENLRWMFSTFHMGHYQPLSWLTLGLDYELWGMDARGYHATNVCLHALTAVAFYYVARRLFGSLHQGRVSGLALPSLAAASVFALHPLRVESVAWVTERRDVLSALFFVLAIGSWLNHAIDGRRSGYVLAGLFVLLSLGAKAAAIVSPALLLVLDVWPLKRTPLGWKRLVLEKLPFVVLGALFGWLAIRAQASQGTTLVALSEHGAVQRVAQAAFGLVFYAWRTLVPMNLIPIHEIPSPIDPLAPRFLIPLVLAVGVTLALVLNRKRWPALLCAWIAFAVLLSPVSGLAQSGPQLVADRYSYFACMPFALLLGGSVLVVLKVRPSWHSGLVVCACALSLGLGVLTFRQTGFWRDSEALWRRTVAIAPTSANGLLNLGSVLMRKGAAATDPEQRASSYDEATSYTLRGLAARPDPQMHVNLGLIAVFRAQDQPRRAPELTALAVEHIRRGLALGEERGVVKPEWRMALGSALLNAGRCDEAIHVLESVRPSMPNTEAMLRSLSLAYACVGRKQEALEVLELAIELEPRNSVLWLRAGELNAALLRIEEARTSYQNVLVLRTSELGEGAAADAEWKRARQALDELR